MAEETSGDGASKISVDGASSGYVVQTGTFDGIAQFASTAPADAETSYLVDLLRELLAKVQSPDLRPVVARLLMPQLEEIHYRLMRLSDRHNELIEQLGHLRRRYAELERIRSTTGVSVVTIYLDQSTGADQVEAAVTNLIESANGSVLIRHDPIRSSWFRRITVAFKHVADSELGQEVKVGGMQAVASRVVHASNAQNTSTMLQNLGPVINSIQSYRDVVIRVEALLIVKLDGALVVHQLTPAQQLTLDRNPDLARLPRDVLPALGVSEREPNFEVSTSFHASERPAVQ